MKRVGVCSVCIVLLLCFVGVIRAVDDDNYEESKEETSQLETKGQLSLSSHQRLYRAETLLDHLSDQLKLDIFGQAWNKASVDGRKDMLTLLFEDDPSFIPPTVYAKKYSPSLETKMSLSDDGHFESQGSLLQLYDGMQDIHRLIFLQESLWPRLDKTSQQTIYSFLEVQSHGNNTENNNEENNNDNGKDSRSNTKINKIPIECPPGSALIGRSCHQLCNMDTDCTEWCSCDTEAFPGLISFKGVCTCRCDVSKYTVTKPCKNVPKNLPSSNLVCLQWFDFAICGMGAASSLSPSLLFLLLSSVVLLFLY